MYGENIENIHPYRLRQIIYETVSNLKKKNKKPNQIEDDFIFCILCGCHHYKNAHIKIKNSPVIKLL